MMNHKFECRINRLALRGVIAMIGGSSADGDRFASITSTLFTAIEKRQRFFLRPLPPKGGYQNLFRLVRESTGHPRADVIVPVRNSVSLSVRASGGSYETLDSYLNRKLQDDPFAAFAGLESRARAACPGRYCTACSVSSHAYGVAAREVLKRSVSSHAFNVYGERIFAPLSLIVPCLMCCIVGNDRKGIEQCQSLIEHFLSGWLPIGRFDVGESCAILVQ